MTRYNIITPIIMPNPSIPEKNANTATPSAIHRF
ncbi:MAG: hypothetical protein KatS3mg017_0575 [Fimbriimonadales bacterium]|nr:MAG: hypothetical protein KatS3mg017_0575 [Fimbriimonadales bacterium]